MVQVQMTECMKENIIIHLKKINTKKKQRKKIKKNIEKKQQILDRNKIQNLSRKYILCLFWCFFCFSWSQTHGVHMCMTTFYLTMALG